MGFDINIAGMNAKKASFDLSKLTDDKINEALTCIADAFVNDSDMILEANAGDVKRAIEAGTSEAMIDRLRLTLDRIKAMAKGLMIVKELENPVGEELSSDTRPNGLTIKKVRCPIGVIGIIYESRPNVTADAFGLCFKTKNAVILRGGSDAIESNKAIVEVIRQALVKLDINPDVVSLVTDTSREVAKQMMQLNKYIDLLIPRGGAGLIRTVVEQATIPVIETGTGNCHVFVDKTADIKMAVDIIHNAKTQRMGVCNACESLVIHKDIAKEAIPEIVADLKEKGIEIRAGKRVFDECANLSELLATATEEDYATEYLAPIISMQIVDDVDEAIAHINRYTTHHSEAIVTADMNNAEKFLNEIDAAAVYVNASTRFTDGFEFGFGAEIGISTQKLHARGPMGLKELTSYKYKIYGDGQIRG